MNDMILNMLANDSFTVSDFKAAGLTAENTKLESEDRYLQSEMIQLNKTFKGTDGNFSKELFHQYYLLATDFYNKMADDTYLEDIKKNTFYSKDNLFAPKNGKTIDETPVFTVSPNPFLLDNSLTRVGKRGERTLSISEIALSLKIYDSDKGKFESESVNDRAFGNNPFKWLGDIFSEPLVIALWDEDGEHIDAVTGLKVSHKKGDYKYNDEGTFYYETLNGRDVYGKQVLNRMNTLTVDGSTANKYDFFDSDDLEQKGFVGNVLKNLALVGSMFLPVVGKPIIAASIATLGVGLLGALGKMFLGSENKTANNMHAWAKTVNRQSASEYASQNTWCWENMINMIGDTVGLLAEQRFLFTHVPALFKGTKGIKARDTKTYQELVEKGAKEIREKTGKDLNKAIEKIKAGITSGSDEALAELQELGLQHATLSHLKASAALEKYMESYNKLGSIMSKTYMTGITIQDTYGEAKANGASDMEALALTLGYAAGEAWILNTGLGEWIMPELQGDKLKYRAIINALKKEVKPLSNDATQTATKQARQNWFKQVFNIGKRVATDDYALQQFASQKINPMHVLLAHAAGEGFEEVSEELLADVSKAAFNTVNWLRGDETRIQGAFENVLDRYGMSLIGGFLGGGISSAGTDFSHVKQLSKMTNESAIQELVYMTNNDKIDDFLKFVNKTDLGNKHLSFEQDENGNFKPGTKENNQDKEIKQMLNAQVQLIKDTISAEGAKFSENALFDALTLKDLRYLLLRDTRTAGLMFLEYNSIITKIYLKSKEIRQLSGEDTNTDTKKKLLSDTDKGRIALLKLELNELRVQKDAITSGKRAPEFIAMALYEASRALHGHNRGYTFQYWAEAQANKKFEDITETELEALRKSYQAYRDTEMKNDIVGDARQFVDLVGLASGAINLQSEYIEHMLTTGRNSALMVQTYLGNMFDGINKAVLSENFDVDAFIEETQKKLNSVLHNTESHLATPLFSDETKARIDYIKNATIDNVYTQQMLLADLMSTILESFADYSDKITQQFIDLGYIHPEVKNHLLNTYQHAIEKLLSISDLEGSLENEGNWNALERLSIYLGKSSDEVFNEITKRTRANIFEDYKTTLQNKIEQIKQLNHTPVVSLLERFKTATSTTNTSVGDVIKNVTQLINLGYSDISTITYGNDLAELIDEVDELIDVLASALYATRVDKAGVNNSWGYSKTLNELNRKYGNDQWIELAEIEGEKAELILQDLALLKQKLGFAKNINSVNSGQKLSQQVKVGYNRLFIFFNKFQRMVNYLPDKLDGWDFEILRRAEQLASLLRECSNEKWSERRFSLTPEEKVQIEREMLMLDDAIHEFFKDKVGNVDELAKLINPDHFNLFDPATGLLTDTVEDLDDNLFIFSLAARAAIKGSSFYNYLRKSYNDEKAPVPMQEQATYLNVAMIMNGDVLNNFAKAYAKSVFESFKSWDNHKKEQMLEKLGYTQGVIDHYVKNPDLLQLDHVVDKFANIVLTEGIAGSGKSGGVFDSTVRVIKQINPELLKNAFFVNATLKNAEVSLNTLDIEGKAFSSSDEETDNDLIRYFYSDFDDNYDGKVVITNGVIQTKFQLRKDLIDLPKVIFIDEASRYDYIKMKLISEAAQHYGIAVLAAGDFDQISAQSKISINGENYVLNPNRLNFIRSSKLGLSFRTLNSQMVANQTEIQANLHNDKKLSFNIHSWEDDKEIRGFKVYEDSNFDKIVASIEKIRKLLKPEDKIGFLYADKNKSVLEKLKLKYGDLIDEKSIDDAQGLEGDYYIIDLNQEPVSTTNKSGQRLRDELYTAITRAKKGGIIINNKVGLPIGVNEIVDEVSELQSITPEQIVAASKKRKEVFNEIFKNIPDEPIEYKELTRVEKESVVDKPEVSDDEDDDIPPPSPSGSTVNPLPGTYRTLEEADRVDLSAFLPGFELYDKDDHLIGTIEGVEVLQVKDSQDNTFYAPTVIVKTTLGSIEAIYSEKLIDYKLKNPSENKFIPKYQVGTVFYGENNKILEILEIIQGDVVKYKAKDESGNVIEIAESDLELYSTIPPISNPTQEDGTDLGENDDPETYRRKLEGANASKDILQRIESDGRINHWMHTFNIYETGVLWDEDEVIKSEHFDGNTQIGQRTRARIDNVNGLIKLGKVTARTTKKECLDMLAKIHSELMYNTDNASIISVLNSLYQFAPGTLATIEYGLKSTAMASGNDPNKKYGTKDSDTDWHVFDKHKDEKSEYAQPDVVAGDAISRKSVVAVFRNSKGIKVLEITVGVLNSPITIGLMTGDNNEYLYPRVGLLLERLRPGLSNDEVFRILTEARQICKEEGYTDLENLFGAFLNTSNAYAPLHKKGETFNLASLFKYGPNITKKKGDYLKNGTREYQAKYIDLNDYVDDLRVVVSEIWIPKSNVFGNVTYPHIHPGHPGVFVSYNKSLTQAELAGRYMALLSSNYTGVRDVEFYYIIPPEATVQEYLRNIRNAYLNRVHGGTRPVYSIGNMWTSYKLLRNIYKGGELTEDKVRSHMLDILDMSDIIGYLDRLIAIEEKTDWSGDPDYERLLTLYKKIYAKESDAKKYAIRNVILQQQEEIMKANFKDSGDVLTGMPVHKVLTNFLANIAYWSKKVDEVPNVDRLAIIEKYNQGTIKYKVTYGTGEKGMFVRAKTPDHHKYSLEGIDSEGNTVTKSFVINGKIDPPIFEFDALKTAVGIMAQWEYKNGDSNNGRTILGDLLNGTRGYIRNGKTSPIPKNNFDLLKDSNKILFEEGGIFHGIIPRGANDPAITQEQFATLILSDFNSQPNNLGFAVVDDSGKVKMYAMRISDLTGDVSRPEAETFKSLGGVTIGKPLVFKPGVTSIEFSTDLRDYQVSIDGNALIFEYSHSERRASNIVPVLMSGGLSFNEEGYQNVRGVIASSTNRLLKNLFSTVSLLDLLDMDSDLRLDYIDSLRSFNEDVSDEQITKLIEYLETGDTKTLNVKIGDKVSLQNGVNFRVAGTVTAIDGTKITLDNNTVIDVSTTSIFKATDYNTINCIKDFKIIYE